MHHELIPALTLQAQRADFNLLIYYYLDSYLDGPDSSNVAGDGLSDLDHFLELYDYYMTAQFPKATIFNLNLGDQNGEGYVEVDREDLQFLRSEYIRFYGNTNRPDVWGPLPEGAAFLAP